MNKTSSILLALVITIIGLISHFTYTMEETNQTKNFKLFGKIIYLAKPNLANQSDNDQPRSKRLRISLDNQEILNVSVKSPKLEHSHEVSQTQTKQTSELRSQPLWVNTSPKIQAPIDRKKASSLYEPSTIIPNLFNLDITAHDIETRPAPIGTDNSADINDSASRINDFLRNEQLKEFPLYIKAYQDLHNIIKEFDILKTQDRDLFQQIKPTTIRAMIKRINEKLRNHSETITVDILLSTIYDDVEASLNRKRKALEKEAHLKEIAFALSSLSKE